MSDTGAAEWWHERISVARACRVMAHRGLVDDILGHVSRRVGPDRVLLRCRGPREHGLRFTVPADVRVVDLDGDVVDGGAERGYAPPSEAPIHLETLRRRPDVWAVVHAHPAAVVAAGLADLPLVPLFGSYDIPAARLAADGIGRYDRSVLIRRADLAAEMLDAMGDRPACVLRGHGLVTTGATVEQAVLRALAVDRLCRVALAVATASVDSAGAVVAIPERDLAELPDLGEGFNTDTLWRHHVACLVADGGDLAPAELSDPEDGR